MDRRAAIGRALRAHEPETPNPAFVSLTDDEQTNGLALFAAEEAPATVSVVVPAAAPAAAPAARAATHPRPPALPEPGNVLVWQVPALAAMLVAVVVVYALTSTTASDDQPVARAAAARDVVPVADAPMPSPPAPRVELSVPDRPATPVVPDRPAPAVVRDPPRVRKDPPVRTAPLPPPRPVEPRPARPAPAPAMAAAAAPVVESPAVLAAVAAPDPGPSTAVPAAVPAAAPVRPAPESAVQTVLTRYRAAYSDLDAGAARAIWPSVDHKALSRAFDRLEQQQLVFDSCAISVTDARATASCRGVATYVPRVGNRDRRDDRREWEFRLSRVDDSWLIDTVSAR